jgi:hypothetical protein
MRVVGRVREQVVRLTKTMGNSKSEKLRKKDEIYQENASVWRNLGLVDCMNPYYFWR